MKVIETSNLFTKLIPFVSGKSDSDVASVSPSQTILSSQTRVYRSSSSNRNVLIHHQGARTIWEGSENVEKWRFGRPIPTGSASRPEGPLPERPGFSRLAFTADRTTRTGLPRKLPKDLFSLLHSGLFTISINACMTGLIQRSLL